MITMKDIKTFIKYVNSTAYLFFSEKELGVGDKLPSKNSKITDLDNIAVYSSRKALFSRLVTKNGQVKTYNERFKKAQ